MHDGNSFLNNIFCDQAIACIDFLIEIQVDSSNI